MNEYESLNSVGQDEFSIFDNVPEPEIKNYFKFENVGDSVQGTYIARNDNSTNSYGMPQTLVTLKKRDGEIVTVSIRHSKVGLLKVLDQVKLGQIIGFKFTGTKENSGGRQPTKYIRLVHDPKFVDEEWLKTKGMPTPKKDDYNLPPDIPMSPQPKVVNVGSAPAKSPVEMKIGQILALAKQKFPGIDESQIKTTIMEKTGLAFININLDLIAERLNNL